MKSLYNEPLHFNTKSFTINDVAEFVMRYDMKAIFSEVFLFVEFSEMSFIMSNHRLYLLIDFFFSISSALITDAMGRFNKSKCIVYLSPI